MRIVGVDEVGRGPLAGPVVAAAALFDQEYSNDDIKDSKQLSPAKREKLSEVIKRDAIAWKIVAVGHHRIRALNIREASRLAMSLAVARCVADNAADLVLVDGNVPIDTRLAQRTVIRGDSIHVQISAASILAKVYRDALMGVLDRKYSGYGLGDHAGYPTKSHRAAIATFGPSPVHRVTFRGVREFLDVQGRERTSPQNPFVTTVLS